MAFVPVPDTVQVETVFNYNSEIVENVYHCQFQVAYDENDIANLLDTFRTWWSTNMVPLVPDALDLINLIGTDQDSQTGPRVEDATGLPISGGSADVPMPGNVTLAVRWLTGQRGRSFRGRTFHVGLGEGAVTGNEVNAAKVSDLTTAYAQLLTDLSTFGAPLVVASRFANGAPRVTGVATLVTSVFIDSSVDSQRRRLAGRGR